MVAMRDIRAFALRVAEEFRPRRIILFGSHAYGKPTRDSDVDVLVVMPYKGRAAAKALEILDQTNPRFGIDLLVRSPEEMTRRVKMRDWFIRDIVENGAVLYESRNKGMDRKGRG